MDNELLEKAYAKIFELEKRIEFYYSMLKVENELSFVLNGTYIFDSDLLEVVNGTY